MKVQTVNPNIRNVAIIAHVDHGKTTLVDSMLSQSGAYIPGSNDSSERVMDSMDLERERGITIAAKNCALSWKGVKINLIDTPGHADFGGEVERALQMVDGAVLLVDASEGPLPQTRFVLSKALAAGLSILVVINKVDRPDARVSEVLDEVYALFIDLDANDEQIEFPVLYSIGRDGRAGSSPDALEQNLNPLLDKIIEEIPGPSYDAEQPFQMLVSNLGYSDYLGRLALGRVFHGSIHKGDQLVRIGSDNVPAPFKISSLQSYAGLQMLPIDSFFPGDIVIIAGVEDVEIGDTITERERPKALRRISVDEPTIAMNFSVNTSPFAGLEGKNVQSTKIAERLQKETLHNVALRVIQGEDAESFIVQGRGEFQMAILLEQMRREGFELSVGRPQIIFREKDGVQLEPIEHVFIDCGETFTGIVTEKLSIRKGRMTNLINHGSGRVRIEFSVPSRGLVGYRNEFLTDTRGTGIMNSMVLGYEEFRGEFPARTTGSLVADRLGEGVAYGLFHLEPRGKLFVVPGDKVYEGMIVGEHNRDNDLDVNVCRTKKLSNMRASGKDEAIVLTPVQPTTLEWAIQFIQDDELVEVTPKTIRMRKKILPANKRPK